MADTTPQPRCTPACSEMHTFTALCEAAALLVIPDAPAPREFHDKAAPRDLGDPATDPPLTVRVRAEPGDQHARLFDRDALRAVKADATLLGASWVVVGGEGDELGAWIEDDDVRTWPVVPAYAVSAPWTLAAAQPAPATCRHCGEAVSQPLATVNGVPLPLWHTADMRVYCEPYDGVRQAELAEQSAPATTAHERGDLDVEAFRG